MPKILSDKTKGLSDSDQMVMALYSESDNNGSPNSNRQDALRPLKTPDDRMADELSDNRKGGLLDKFRLSKRL
ncbi:MAG: hypothetical protein V1777_02255 [Candidatus Micrarchaeota archaeon]